MICNKIPKEQYCDSIGNNDEDVQFAEIAESTESSNRTREVKIISSILCISFVIGGMIFIFSRFININDININDNSNLTFTINKI